MKMATFASPITDNCKENSFEANGSFELTDNVNKKESNNDRAIFYKKPIKKNNFKLELDYNETPQEIRRQRILYHQKKSRNSAFNAGRGLLEEVLNSENEEEMEEEENEEFEEQPEEMEVDKIKRRRFKPRKDYARMFMLSEWMLEVPQDFAEKWIMVPCPVGKRVLLVACKGFTRMYSRRGFQISKFKSVLPGGNPKNCKNSCTILDCIWLKSKRICYVLDVLAWSNQEMLNCEASFRFYWLRSQLNDLSESKEPIKGINDYPILPLPSLDCNCDSYEFLKNIDTSLQLDGILFYHKEAHYTSGKTPLVAWLKTYMLPEVLSINVPDPFNEKPNNYIDFEHHVLTVIQAEKLRIENFQKNKKEQKEVEQEKME